MKNATLFTLILVMVLVKMGCAQNATQENQKPLPESEEAIELNTSETERALYNLNSQIEALEFRMSEHPQDIMTAEKLVDLRLSRAAYLGNFEDFKRSLEIADALLQATDRSLSSLLLRARAYIALHEFDAALMDMNECLTNYADDPFLESRLEKLMMELSLTGATFSTIDSEQLPEVLHPISPEMIQEVRASEAAIYDSYRAHAESASAKSILGQYEAADMSFIQSVNVYRDVSPFPFAWVSFQRGVMWSESAGRNDLGELYYKEALSSFGKYTVARVHLAELLWEEDVDLEQSLRTQTAVQLLEGAIEFTNDPEPRGLLAEIIGVDTRRGRQLIAEADRLYQERLAQFPLAFSDHACEFYMGPGDDLEQAYELAKLNIINRVNPRALSLVMRASLALSESVDDNERCASLMVESCNFAQQAIEFGRNVVVAEEASSILATNCST